MRSQIEINIIPVNLSEVGLFSNVSEKVARQEARKLNREAREAARAAQATPAVPATQALQAAQANSVTQQVQKAKMVSMKLSSPLFVTSSNNVSETLYSYLERQTKNIAFKDLSPIQQADLLHENRANAQFINLLQQHLMKHPSFLYQIMKFSIECYQKIITSRLGLFCTNKQLAMIIIHYQKESLDNIRQKESDPMSVNHIYLNDIKKILKSKGTTLEQLFKDPKSCEFMMHNHLFNNYNLACSQLRLLIQMATIAQIDYYSLLHVSRHASSSEIKDAYNQIKSENNNLPDDNNLIDAYDILTSPQVRDLYDKHHPDAGKDSLEQPADAASARI